MMAEIGDVRAPQTIPLETFEEALANYNRWNAKMPNLPGGQSAEITETAGGGTNSSAQNEDEVGGA